MARPARISVHTCAIDYKPLPQHPPIETTPTLKPDREVVCSDGSSSEDKSLKRSLFAEIGKPCIGPGQTLQNRLTFLDAGMSTPSATPSALAGQIVSAYASNHSLAYESEAELFQRVENIIVSLDGTEDEPLPPVPAVPIRKSVYPDYVNCLEDGRRLKMLKRHLRAAYDMTPDQYRARWSLPANYPMVAPNYSNRRRVLAIEAGLGRSEEQD